MAYESGELDGVYFSAPPVYSAAAANVESCASSGCVDFVANGVRDEIELTYPAASIGDDAPPKVRQHVEITGYASNLSSRPLVIVCHGEFGQLYSDSFSARSRGV